MSNTEKGQQTTSKRLGHPARHGGGGLHGRGEGVGNILGIAHPCLTWVSAGVPGGDQL